MQPRVARSLTASSTCRQYFYAYLTEEGINYLREYLALPATVAPQTKTQPATQQRPSGGRGTFGLGAARTRCLSLPLCLPLRRGALVVCCSFATHRCGVATVVCAVPVCDERTSRKRLWQRKRVGLPVPDLIFLMGVLYAQASLVVVTVVAALTSYVACHSWHAGVTASHVLRCASSTAPS